MDSLPRALSLRSALALLGLAALSSACEEEPKGTAPVAAQPVVSAPQAPAPVQASAPVTPPPAETPTAPEPVAEAPTLAFPAVDADLLYAAKVKRPKSPRRRRRAVGAKKPKKSGGSVAMGDSMSIEGLLNPSAGGGGGYAPKKSAAAAPSFAPPAEPARDDASLGATAGSRSQGRPARGKKREKGVAPANTRYLSADDSNSQASPVLVRQAIMSGRYVDPSLVRAYEFLNYYTFDYTPAAAQELAIEPHMRPTSNPDEFSLQVGVRASDLSREGMKPLHTTIVLDTSGSMAGPPSELARAFVDRFARSLRAGDEISLVVTNRDATVLIEHHVVTSAQDVAGDVTAALARPDARPNDVTNLERGIKVAYEIAGNHRADGKSSRVMLISDGATNFGRLSKKTIAKHADDADKEGIYLIGVGLGVGFNDQLMDAFTDRGRGAYVFLDTEAEIDRILAGPSFVSNFDVSLKDVRLKMVMPDGWSVKSFHGEQISRVKAKVTPQYLAPNDQMIYHMVLAAKPEHGPLEEARFEFEAEYTPIGGEPKTKKATATAAAMNGQARAIIKGDALVIFAETLRKMKYPLDRNREANLELYTRATKFIADAQRFLQDEELEDLLELMSRYRQTLDLGEVFPGARDRQDESPDAVLGISPQLVGEVTIRGARPSKAIKGLTRLRDARKLVPQEGYRFLALSTGPVGNAYPAGTGELRQRTWRDPQPRFMGNRRSRGFREPVWDLHQITIELTAPEGAQSFSFDFNYFSAEYPEFIQQEFNDTFYAILRADSTNNGAATNISFDANRNSIEVDNNYFQNQFHPIPNWGTGFDYHGSTGWLRTSWPIQGGEKFTITFSVHDEGDGVYDSLVLLDNFKFHDHQAVGTTDPLN